MYQRRTVPSGSFTSATSYQVVAYPGTTKLKRKRRSKVTPLGRRVLTYILGSLIAVWILRKLLLPAPSVFRPYYRIEPHVAKHIKYYDFIHTGGNPSEGNGPTEKRRFQFLGPTYGADVSMCDLTVLFMDPRIADPNYKASGPAWFALESLAAYAPDDGTVCVLLLTHYCAMQNHMTLQQEAATTDKSPVTDYAAQEAVRDLIYSRSLPLFRDMIHRGRVRVQFVDVNKYQLKSCEDFGDPTPAFVHIDFWTREFIKNIDSDIVLVMQDDVVLCQALDLWHLEQFAYIGGLWPKEPTDLYPFPEQGMCRAMPGYWKSWLAPQRKRQRAEDAQLELEEVLDENFPAVCGNGEGPIGNGGFSMRQRTWMQTAIATCPHDKYSGMDLKAESLACKVLDQVEEDVYFSVILRGMGASLPTAADAALFSAETLLLEDAVAMYGVRDGTDYRARITKTTKAVSYQGKARTIPVGLHKPWWYLPKDLLQEMHKACPYLKYIYSSNDVRADGAVHRHHGKTRRVGRVGT